MKVYELIKSLKKLDQEMEICFVDSKIDVIEDDVEFGDFEVSAIRKVKGNKNFDEEDYYLLV